MVMAISMATVHWSIMGMFLVGESPQLSPRVQRTLPKTSAGRALLSWFFPGPARGYVFVLANLAAGVAMALLTMLTWEAMYPPAGGGFRPVSFDHVAMLGIVCLGYVAFYLGLGKLVLTWLRGYSVVGALTSVLVHVLLVLAGCGIPLVIHLMSDMRMGGYNLLHVGNPFWTIVEVVERGGSVDATVAVWIVAAGGVVMVLLNLRSILEEVRLVRAASPSRVAEEEAALAALRAPTAHTPRSPWDEVE
jgi:hypothetical protein